MYANYSISNSYRSTSVWIEYLTRNCYNKKKGQNYYSTKQNNKAAESFQGVLIQKPSQGFVRGKSVIFIVAAFFFLIHGINEDEGSHALN